MYNINFSEIIIILLLLFCTLLIRRKLTKVILSYLFVTEKYDQSWKNNHIGRNITVTNNSDYGKDRHCIHGNTIVKTNYKTFDRRQKIMVMQHTINLQKILTLKQVLPFEILHPPKFTHLYRINVSEAISKLF